MSTIERAMPVGIMDQRLRRRTLLQSGAGAAGLAAASLLGGHAVADAAQETACGGENVTITYGFWNAQQRPAVEAQIAAFQEQHPNITVEPQVVPWADYWTKLQTGVAGGETYDVFWMNGPNLPVYAAQGSLMDLQPATEADGVDLSLYPQSLVDLYTHDGTSYGLPRDLDTIALLYNRDLFDQAGVAYPTEEWTWDDLRAAAEALTIKEGDVTAQWGFAVTLSDQQTLFNFIHQNGGQVLSEDGSEALVGEPAACEAIQFLGDMIADGLSPSVAEQQANDPYQTLFPAGRIAMIQRLPVALDTLHEANPAIAIAPLPMKEQRASMIHGLGHAVWASTAHPCEAMEFAAFLASREAEEILGATATVIPAMDGLQETWLQSIPDLDLQVYLDAIEYSVPFPTSPAGTEWNAQLDEVLLQAWSGDIPEDEVCARAAEAANSVLPAGQE